MSESIKAHIALFVVALVYGANYVIAKGPMDEGYLGPLPFIALRVSSAVVLFWLIRASLGLQKVQKTDLFRMALCGLFGVAINQMFFFTGLSLTTPINGSLIMTTTPILVLVVSAMLIGERITIPKVIGIALGATGAGLLIGYGKSITLGGAGSLGDILIFINALSYGVYLVLVKTLMAKYQPLTVITWVFTFGWLIVLPFGLPGLLQTDFARFTPQVWLAVAYVLLGTTVLVYLLNAWALQMVNPSVVSIYIYLQPLFAGIISLGLGQEELSPVKLVSAGAIFSGVYLVSFSDHLTKKKRAAATKSNSG